MSSSAIVFGQTDVSLQGAVGFKNRIINGNFDIWQRGTSQTSTGYGSDDRWINDHSGSTKTHSQQTFILGQTDVPGNPRFFSRTVVTSVAGSGNLVAKYQRIEGVRTLAGQIATLSFWAKADASRNMAVELGQIFGTGGSPSSTINGIGVTTCALTTSWKKFTITTTLPTISGKTLGTNNNDWLEVVFWLDAGSSFNSRTNSLGQQSGTFDIAQVQLEAGTIATPFENRPVGAELALCQRYYYRPGSNSTSTNYMLGNGFADSTTLATINFWMPVEMRAAPTVSSSGPATLALSTYAGSGITISSIPSTTFNGTMGNLVAVQLTASGMTAGVACKLSKFNSAAQYIDFSSEL